MSSRLRFRSRHAFPGTTLITLILLGNALRLPGQQPIPSPAFGGEARILDASIDQRLRAHVRYLASDELEGRRTGTRGNLLAAGYIAGYFNSVGLLPVDSTFLHSFNYLAGIEESGNSRARVTFNSDPSSTTAGLRRLDLVVRRDFIPLSFSSNRDVEGGLVFVGYGITAPDLGYDDYAGVDAEGKIAVMFRYSPDGQDIHGKFSEQGTFVAKVVNARKHGVKGIMMIDMEEPENLTELQLMRGFVDVGLPTISVLPATFDLPIGPEMKTLEVLYREITENRTPQSFVMENWNGLISTNLLREEVQAPNIVGLLPGVDPALADEIIVIGAHFDHLGHGGEGSLYGHNDSAIHNGADDNASGTACVMELARQLSSMHGNRRTIVFVAFNGEEEGLLGSAELLEQNDIPTEKIVAMINLDMVGRMAGDTLIVQGTGTATEWDRIIDGANMQHLVLRKVRDGYGPSDHSSFYAKKIPVLFMFTGIHSDYHRPSDDWNLVNYSGMAEVVNFVSAIVQQIDLRQEPPTYVDVPRPAATTNVRLRVVLGVMPDYAYDGKGLRITDVSDGGAAERGGIQGGDVIVSLNGTDVGNIEEYMLALSSIEPEQEVEVIIVRGTERITTTVVPGKR